MSFNVLVTFDIDGTLIGQGLGGVDHRAAFRYAMKTLFGIDQDPNQYLNRDFIGCTDIYIASESIKKATNSETASQELIDKFYQLSGEYFVKVHKPTTKLLPGVESMLKTLSSMEGVHLGLVSGNVPAIGWKKLQVLNIDHYFDKNLAGLGSHMERADIVRHVMKTCADLYGPLTRAIHVGDAMQDIEAALDAGALAVAVDTGSQPNKIFKQPSFFIENLEKDAEQFLSVVKTGKSLSGEDHIDQRFSE